MAEEETMNRIAKSLEIIAEGTVRTYNVSWIGDALKILLLLGILLAIL